MKPSWKECLEGLSESSRIQIAVNRKEADSSVEGLADQSRLQQGIGSWSSLERNLLEDLVFRFGHQTIREGGPLWNSLPFSNVRRRLGMTLLRQKGVCFLLKEAWGERVYFCPEEVQKAFLSTLFNEKEENSGEIKILQQEETGSGIWNQLFHLLVMVEQEKISLTQKGKLSNPWIQKLDAELGIEGMPLQGSPWCDSEHSPGLSLLLDVAFTLGLLRKEQGFIVPVNENVKNWLRTPWSALMETLYRFIKNRLLEKKPELASLWMLLELRGRGETGSLRTVVTDWKEKAGNHQKVGRLTEELFHNWLRPLAAMGWLEAGETEEGPIWCWMPWTPPIGDLPSLQGYVKPDCEVLLPGFYPLSKRWLLAQYADWKGGDQLLIYSLSQSSVQRGRKAGLTSEEMLVHLKEIASGPLPETVIENVKTWGEVSTITLRQVWLASISGTPLTDLQVRNPHCECTESGALIIEKSALEEMKELLEAQGYRVNWEEEEQRAWWEDVDKRDTFQKDSWPPKTGKDPKVMDQIPDLKDSVPGFHHLPRMWTSGMRSYHPSTLEGLIRKAAELELDLKWESVSGERREFTPVCIFHRGEAVMTEGWNKKREKVQLPLQDIHRIQVATPWEENG